MNKDVILKDLKLLIEKYGQVKKDLQIKKYSEEETKKDFILPLFEILGWDVFNRNEVSAEEHIASSGRVDYGFYINGRIKFYLEAKSLKGDLNREEYARQAIRYSFNKGATWAILTDFESIKVFNAQAISKYLGDKLYFEIPYDKYIDRLDQLLQLSKTSFEKDLIDIEAKKVGKMLQKVPVGELLYKDLKECREILLHDLSLWNEKVDKELLDEGVQKILDRLIFLRVAEDRKIEPPTLIPLIREWESTDREMPLYKSMISTFRELDSIYNSNLFSKHPFENWEDYSDATKRVIKILYGKEGYYEYDFKAMPADILGGVYENYLGYKLSQSKKGLSVGENAKKRKEQGIYYTPAFIVDYIVRNALKPVLDRCKSVSDLKKIKVLDPACGSGSFLIKALEIIADKYRDFNCRVDEFTKIEIIMENLYGVDLDAQAVEIARLNLLINTLEQRGIMPSLDKNIKNGNSLISGTDEELEKYFGKNFKDKKPFNWEEEFPEVFKQGGFDVIIGNPPYIFARGGNFDDNEKKYYADNYKKLQQYQLNTFLLFIEKGYDLLKENGAFGFIIPNNWLTINSFSKLREFLLKNIADLKIINAIESVFNQASVDTCLLLFRKEKPTNVEVGELRSNENPILTKHSAEDFYKNEFVINISQKEDAIKSNINLKNTIELGTISEVSTGLKSYQVGKGNPPQDEKVKIGRVFHSNKKEDKTYKPYLQGVDVKRYYLDWSGEYLSYGDWLAEPRKSVPFSGDRILVRQIPSPLPYCVNSVFTNEDYLNDINSMVVFNVEKRFNIKYILAILNSKFISYWFAKTFDKFQRKIFPQFKVNELARFPIYKADSKQQKIIIDLVDKMLSLNKDVNKIPEHSGKWESLENEIEKTNKKIDDEIYRLYGLTQEEIKIAESKNMN